MVNFVYSVLTIYFDALITWCLKFSNVGRVNNDISYIWNHGPKVGGGFDCRYCPLKSRGGGATRFREHLAGIPGEVQECPNVPSNVRAAMKKSQNMFMKKKREKATRKL